MSELSEERQRELTLLLMGTLDAEGRTAPCQESNRRDEPKLNVRIPSQKSLGGGIRSCRAVVVLSSQCHDDQMASVTPSQIVEVPFTLLIRQE